MGSFEIGPKHEQLNKEEEMQETKEVKEFKPEEAANQEKSVLDKLRGKAKQIGGVLVLVSALTIGSMAMKKEVYAEQKESGIKAEQVEKTPEQRAINFLEKLYNLPDNPRANSPQHNEILKEQAARDMIRDYALQKKMGFPSGDISGRVSPLDIRDALKDINDASGLFADKQFGNQDGKPDIEEIQKMQEATKDKTGLRTFFKMFFQYEKMFPKR